MRKNDGMETVNHDRSKWRRGHVRARWMDGVKEMTQLGLSELGGWTE